MNAVVYTLYAVGLLMTLIGVVRQDRAMTIVGVAACSVGTLAVVLSMFLR